MNAARHFLPLIREEPAAPLTEEALYSGVTSTSEFVGLGAPTVPNGDNDDEAEMSSSNDANLFASPSFR